LNVPDDVEIALKPHTPHIKFVDVNDANKFSVVIFIDMGAKKEERFLEQEKRLDSYSFENIVDTKVKLHAYLFFVFVFNFKNFKKISKIGVFVFCFDKKKLKIKKMVQADLYLKN